MVAALPGDTVALTSVGITVNGRLQLHSRPLLSDRSGRSLPQLAARSYVVRRGYTWLFAPSDRSFDSRYLGELRTTNIVARVQPYWTLGESRLDPQRRP
jgi:type IV secretory pathway protease TraF